jgi:biopolymer transport protein ExbD
MQFHEASRTLFSTRAKSGRRVFINITSLIDVIFMLLLFFVISTTFLDQQGMKLELPASKTADSKETQAYTLFLGEDGSLRLNEKEVSFENLSAALKNVLPEMTEGALSLHADKKVPHGQVVKAMDAARQAGVKKLMVATTPEQVDAE